MRDFLENPRDIRNVRNDHCGIPGRISVRFRGVFERISEKKSQKGFLMNSLEVSGRIPKDFWKKPRVIQFTISEEFPLRKC